MVNEIGSEFYNLPGSYYKSLGKNLWDFVGISHYYYLSGRTAIDYIIKDISSKSKIEKVLLPSYGCETMIIPFMDNNIEVSYYNVDMGVDGVKVNIDKMHNADVIVVMNYFGFQSPYLEKFIDELSSQNIIIIKDATQSLFSETAYDERVDYIFSSLRKWMGVPDGALLAKRGGLFNISLPKDKNIAYVKLRMEAMQLKKSYITQNQGSKEAYLMKFAEASQILSQDYTGYRMSEQSIELLKVLDVDTIKTKRQQNANFLIEALKQVKGIRLPFNFVEEDEVPLFVPILVEGEVRDALRKHLIKQQIYCPVHWPLSSSHKISDKAKEIYYNELSLVCDQRYNIADMQRIVDAVRTFFKLK